ncbi:MAG: HYC_CC_PP family protein [Janthinobacterium lividum]
MLLYLITATGFAMNLHFCGKSIESVKINAPAKDCGMSSKCCKDTHVEVKVKDVHQTAHTSFTGNILVSLVPLLGYASFLEPLTIKLVSKAVSERGPPLVAVPVYLKNCTFRI